MTKKRFIKLLMSHGVPIHEAQTKAFWYNAFNIPYKNAYSHYKTKRAFNSLSVACEDFSRNLLTITQSFKKFVEAMSNDTGR